MTNTTVVQESPRVYWPLFALGRVVGTPGAVKALAQAGDDARTFLRRHSFGDWGDVCEEDGRANDKALGEGTRIFSAYHTSAGEKIWCITEWERSYTTLLLPEEY